MFTLTPEVWAEVQVSSPKIAAAMRKDPTYKDLTLKFDEAAAKIMADRAAARMADLKANGAVVEALGGKRFTYAELLMLATISVKGWYELPEENPVAVINAEIAAILHGVQSREATALKAAIAEALAQ